MHGITIAAELAYLAADERLEDGNAFLLLEDSDNKDIAKSCRKSANQFTRSNETERITSIEVLDPRTHTIRSPC